MTLFQNNRALLDAFRLGDRKALYAVYQFYSKDIERIVASEWFSRKTKFRTNAYWNNDVGAELIQEIFLRAFSKNARLSYDGIRSYKNYLLTIARNAITDYFHSRPNDASSHPCVTLDVEKITNERLLALENRIAEDESPEDTLYWQRCVVAMREYVETLDLRWKKFVQLRFQQELPLLEVARRLDITRGKARHIENKLGKKLKRYLEDRNLSPDGKKADVTTKL